MPKKSKSRSPKRSKSPKKSSKKVKLPGAVYYKIGSTKVFSIRKAPKKNEMGVEYRDLRANLKKNTMAELDNILSCFEITQKTLKKFHKEDYSKEKDENYKYSDEYKAERDKKIALIKGFTKVN
jgi:hypothetical protein